MNNIKLRFLVITSNLLLLLSPSYSNNTNKFNDINSELNLTAKGNYNDKGDYIWNYYIRSKSILVNQTPSI